MVTKNTMDDLLRFNVWINGETFRGYFVEKNNSPQLAQHLWLKFSQDYNFDLLKFYAHLDNKNRKILISMINDFKKLGKSNFTKIYFSAW